jgi:beta-glucosidase
MMTGDEKIAQLHQVERANTTASDITQYGVGSVYSQGGSGPATNTPTGWADMIDGFRTASYASRLKIPVIYGLDTVHGVGPVKGATVFPHNIGLGATRDPALVEEVAGVVADETAGAGADFPFAPVVAVARALGPHLRSVRRDRRAGVRDGRRLHERLPETQRPVQGARERQALPG